MADTNELISADQTGNAAGCYTPRQGGCTYPKISADGRFVVFTSTTASHVANDKNEFPDIFVKDREIGTTVRINLADSGAEANSGSDSPDISADGRYVVYRSDATNLVPGQGLTLSNIFLYDGQAKTTRLISQGPDGAAANGRSQNPKVIAGTELLVVFESEATDLTPNDTASSDVFLYREPILVEIPTGATKKAVREAVNSKVSPVVASDLPSVAVEAGATIFTLRQFILTEVNSAAAKRRKFKLSYEIRLAGGSSKKGTNKRARLRRSKTGRTIFRKLKKGSYRARYRVVVKQGKKTVARSDYSGSRNFTVR